MITAALVMVAVGLILAAALIVLGLRTRDGRPR